MFNPERLSLIVQPVGDGGLRFYSYQTDDTEATVTGAGYATNAADYGLRAYDLIFVSPLSGAVDTYILAVDTIDADGHATLASPGPIGDLLAANNLSDIADAAAALSNLGGMAKATYDPTNVGGDAFDMDNMVEGADTKILTAAERSAIAALGTASTADLLDEDDFASDSATDVPSQQSVKAFATAKFVATRTALKDISTAVHTTAYLSESGREGTFDFRSGDFSTLVAADTYESIYIVATDTASTSGAWVRRREGFVFKATWGGVIADGVTNQSAIINSLYQLASTLAYSEFWLPGSLTNKIAIASQLLFNKSNILVRGAGPGHHHDLGVSNTVDFGTALLWTGSTGGGSTMIYFGPSSGATNRRVSGGGLIDVALYGDLKADYGLVCRSTFHAQFRIFVNGQLTVGAYFGIQATLGEASDVQHCMIDIRGVMYDATAGKGVILTGSATANVSYNECWFWFGYYNSTAVEIGNSDHNVFHKIWCYRKSGGTAYGVDVLGGPSNSERARRNVFKQFNAGAGGSIFRGTADYTFPTIDNIIDEFDVGNLQPAPVIGTGATVHWRTDTREHHTQEGRNLSPVLTAIPDADVSMSSATTGTTFQDVPGMSFYLMASSLYRYTVEYVHDGPSTDAKRIFTGPAGATAWAAFDHTTRSATILGPFSSANIDDTAVGTKTRATESGVIKTGATAGTLQLQWAQAVADAGVTTLYRDGTVMTLQKIF